MRPWLITPAVWFLTTSCCVAQSAAESFPYSAFVAGGDTPVRSGPGEQFYPVLHLQHGDAVEVWRHDPGGWCAIRPPAGSFSWITAEFLQPIDEKTAVVRGRQVNVRVGTQFSDIRDAIQVQLDDGDQVAVLEAPRRAIAAGEATWCKILPPAGEFRWIHQDRLVRHPDQLPPPADVVRNKDPFAARQVGFEEAVADGRSPGESESPAVDAAATLDDLETALSRMVAAEPTAWHFRELQRRGEALLEKSETAVDRSRVRTYLGKLARFEDIRRRYAQIAELRTQTATIDHQLQGPQPTADAATVSANTAKLDTADVSRYDGIGRLTSIVTQDSRGPSYALTDERGEIVAFVVAAPGVNLRQYAGLEVGINGIKGFVADKRIAQLTAKRIDVLSARTASASSRRR